MPGDHITMSKWQTLRVVSSTPDLLELESTWQPHGDPPPTHWHPAQHEHFEVLEGELTVRLGGEERAVVAGSALDVEPRTPHAMWNAGAEVCRATWQVTPALRTVDMFHTIDSGPGKVGQALMLWRFRREFRLGRPRR